MKMKRIGVFLLLFVWISSFSSAQAAETIKWVDFHITHEAMERALALDIEGGEKECPVSWITLLAMAACETGGKVTVQAVNRAKEKLDSGKSPKEALGELGKYYDYYHEAYEAVLGGLVGNYAIQTADGWKPAYGLKAFSPIAAGYGYNHYDDFGASRSFGFRRKHLGHDMLGTLGTPIVAVEGGTVEALGWNRYGGWRVGIRSDDKKRYYYYAHMRKDAPYAPGLQQGDRVQAGQLIGFMGRTGYSNRENVNNIDVVHLHFGIQLIFDETSENEIWIDVYDLVQLLDRHRSSWVCEDGTWRRQYPYRDLDKEE